MTVLVVILVTIIIGLVGYVIGSKNKGGGNASPTISPHSFLQQPEPTSAFNPDSNNEDFEDALTDRVREDLVDALTDRVRIAELAETIDDVLNDPIFDKDFFSSSNTELPYKRRILKNSLIEYAKAANRIVHEFGPFGRTRPDNSELCDVLQEHIRSIEQLLSIELPRGRYIRGEGWKPFNDGKEEDTLNIRKCDLGDFLMLDTITMDSAWTRLSEEHQKCLINEMVELPEVFLTLDSNFIDRIWKLLLDEQQEKMIAEILEQPETYWEKDLVDRKTIIWLSDKMTKEQYDSIKLKRYNSLRKRRGDIG